MACCAPKREVCHGSSHGTKNKICMHQGMVYAGSGSCQDLYPIGHDRRASYAAPHLSLKSYVECWTTFSLTVGIEYSAHAKCTAGSFLIEVENELLMAAWSLWLGIL
eukprot:1154103-Pelagomonas_calceolata.AAC.4